MTTLNMRLDVFCNHQHHPAQDGRSITLKIALHSLAKRSIPETELKRAEWVLVMEFYFPLYQFAFMDETGYASGCRPARASGSWPCHSRWARSLSTPSMQT